MKKLNIYYKFLIVIIATMLFWFLFMMIDLDKKQDQIDEIKNTIEENNKQYEELHKQVEKELADGNIL